jgi:hypothetical protein
MIVKSFKLLRIIATPIYRKGSNTMDWDFQIDSCVIDDDIKKRIEELLPLYVKHLINDRSYDDRVDGRQDLDKKGIIKYDFNR